MDEPFQANGSAFDVLNAWQPLRLATTRVVGECFTALSGGCSATQVSREK